MPVTVSTFYKFVAVEDCRGLRAALLELCQRHSIKGTILVAPEGINATISGCETAVRAVHAWLRSDPRFAGLETKDSTAGDHPFRRLKVRLKCEIVTFGAPEADPTRVVGTYVEPCNWNALIADPEVVVLDTRNAYEVAIGTFERAVDPGTRAFSEFRDFVAANLDPARHKKVAMFCTGGIRCEKASSYMKAMGFAEIYHLQGGILTYLETVPAHESLWRGACFVFDERVALGHGLEPGMHALCSACGHPIVHADGACPGCAA